MKTRTRRLLGGLALAGATLGAVGAVMMKKSKRGRPGLSRGSGVDVWARPGMNVTFRAEVMPGRDRAERTFQVKELLSSGRVLLQSTGGEHAEREFEPIQ